jgi:hypothetical protein
MNKIYVKLSLFTIILLANACKIPFDEVDLNVKLTPEYAVPLVESNMDFRDLFDGFNGSAYLEVQADGTFKMVYKSKVLETLPFNLLTSLPTVSTFPVTHANMAAPFPMPSNTRIEALDFKNGFFKWRFDAQPVPLNVQITFHQLTKNGETFSRKFKLTNAVYKDSLDLTDWHCEPTQGYVGISYKATTDMGESVSLDNQGAYELTRFQAKMMKGYFGQFLVALPKDTVALEFFRNWRPNGKIVFSEPKITYNFENSFGFPIEARTSSAESINLAGQKMALQSPLTNGVNLPYPSINEMGTAKTFLLNIDNKNSNITDLFGSNPKSFSQSLIGISNLTNPSKVSGFITESSRLKASYIMEVPMIGAAQSFVVFDTIPLLFSNFSEATAAEFKLTTDNTLPLDMNLQAYFYNGSGILIDSLVDKQPVILRGAPTTTTGTTIGSNLAYNFIKMDAAKFTNVRSTQRIIVKYTVSSTNVGVNPVRINATQKFNLKLGVRVGVNL